MQPLVVRGQVASVDHAGHDLHGGRIYTTTTMTAVAGDRTWLLRTGAIELALLCSAFRPNHSIPLDSLRHPFTTFGA